jgi:hypothetical protein
MNCYYVTGRLRGSCGTHSKKEMKSVVTSWMFAQKKGHKKERTITTASPL